MKQIELLGRLIVEGERWPQHTIIAGIFWDETTPLLKQIMEIVKIHHSPLATKKIYPGTKSEEVWIRIK